MAIKEVNQRGIVATSNLSESIRKPLSQVVEGLGLVPLSVREALQARRKRAQQKQQLENAGAIRILQALETDLTTEAPLEDKDYIALVLEDNGSKYDLLRGGPYFRFLIRMGVTDNELYSPHNRSSTAIFSQGVAIEANPNGNPPNVLFSRSRAPGFPTYWRYLDSPFLQSAPDMQQAFESLTNEQRAETNNLSNVSLERQVEIARMFAEPIPDDRFGTGKNAGLKYLWLMPPHLISIQQNIVRKENNAQKP